MYSSRVLIICFIAGQYYTCGEGQADCQGYGGRGQGGRGGKDAPEEDDPEYGNGYEFWNIDAYDGTGKEQIKL